MTDTRKPANGKSSEKSKKLRLNKETLKDLGTSKTEQVRGGAAVKRCANEDTGCPHEG